MDKNRICDICHYKVKNKEVEITKKSILRTMGFNVKNLENKIRRLKVSDENKVVHLTKTKSRL